MLRHNMHLNSHILQADDQSKAPMRSPLAHQSNFGMDEDFLVNPLAK